MVLYSTTSTFAQYAFMHQLKYHIGWIFTITYIEAFRTFMAQHMAQKIKPLNRPGACFTHNYYAGKVRRGYSSPPTSTSWFPYKEILLSCWHSTSDRTSLLQMCLIKMLLSYKCLLLYYFIIIIIIIIKIKKLYSHSYY